MQTLTLTGCMDNDFLVFSYLDDQSLLNFCKTNKYVYKLYCNESFWKTLLWHKYGDKYNGYKNSEVTWKDCYKYVSTINRSDKIFRDIFNDRVDKFKYILEKTSAIISGSVVIQTILDEKWNDSDIDIYIPVGNMTYESPSENPSSLLEKWLYKNKYKMDSYHAANRYGNNMTKGYQILFIRNYLINGYKLQIINVNVSRENLEDFIISNYDFDICKNILRLKNGAYELKIKSLKSIINKNFNFSYKGNILSSLLRKVKYEKRGFKITIVDTTEELLSQISYKVEGYSDHEYGHGYIHYTCLDITKFNGCKIPNWPDNVDDYDNFNDKILKKLLKKHRRDKCSNVCPFDVLGYIHCHLNGNHIAHGSCHDLVILEDKLVHKQKRRVR